jgi:hypothetical protein
MTPLNEKLDQFNTGHPESVVRYVENIICEMDKHLIQIENQLEPADYERLTSNYEYLKAFFLYVYPLIEPMAYCRIDETVLVSKQTKETINELSERVKNMLRNSESLESIYDLTKTLTKNLENRYRE